MRRSPRTPHGEAPTETPRITGAVYRASGWIQVGTTQGRYDREKLCDKPPEGRLAPAPCDGTGRDSPAAKIPRPPIGYYE